MLVDSEDLDGLVDIEEIKGVLEKQLSKFIEKNAGETYNFEGHEVVYINQKVIDQISPPKTYPNPNFNISKINTILGLIELHKGCGYPKCPFNKTDLLEESLWSVVKNPVITDSMKIVNDLEEFCKNFPNKNELCVFNQCVCNCKNMCRVFLDKLCEYNKCSFEMTEDELTRNKEIHAIGLYLTNSYYIEDKFFEKGSILISTEIHVHSPEFALTYVHESTHALLDDLFGSKVHTKKGFNEGFAVAMEYYYSIDNELEFNYDRHGEYLAHEMLTLPDDISILKRMIASVKDKFYGRE